MSAADAEKQLKGLLGIGFSGKETPNKTPGKKKKKKDVNRNRNAGGNSNKDNIDSKNKDSSNRSKANSITEKKSVKKKKKKNEKTNKNTGSGSGGDGSSNFAWSAFQSPPDASSLPLPAFGSFDDAPVTPKKEATPEQGTVKETNQEISAINAENDIKRLLNIPMGTTDDSENSERSGTETNLPDTNQDEMKHSSGVNLASLVLNDTPPAEKKKVLNTPEQDPLVMLMNPSYGSDAYNMNTGHPMKSPYNRPSVSGQIPYGMQSPAAPYRPVMHQPFITLQVQVPADLLPGRRMIVPVSHGYAPSVVVPDGVKGGMFIPVTVPSMYGQVPMGYVQQMSPNHIHMQQQGQPGQQHSFSSPMARPDNEKFERKPTTWAERAAATNHPSDKK